MGMLRPFLLITDTLFMIYWAVTAAFALDWVTIDPALLFSDYADPRTVAWNWSFFPIDFAFAITGYACIMLHSRGNPMWRPVALISLTLTFCAGVMAISYWTIIGEFDPLWFLPNLALAIWPLFFIHRLLVASTDAASLSKTARSGTQ